MKHKNIVYLFALLFIFIGSVNLIYLKTSLFEDFNLQVIKSFSIFSNIEEDLSSSSYSALKCDVVIAGGGASGVSAAIASARSGADTCLIEETDWLGGMLTSAGVSGIDGKEETPSGIFKEFLTDLKVYYASRGMLSQTLKCDVSYFCFEPEVGAALFEKMADEEDNLRIFFNSKVNKVYRENNQIIGLAFTQAYKKYAVKAEVVIDATEFGDLMYLADIPYDLGPEPDLGESLYKNIEQCIQPLTYVAVLEKTNSSQVISKPDDYDEEDFNCILENKDCPDSNTKFDKTRLFKYGALPNNKIFLNIPSHSYGNDFHATAKRLDDYERGTILKEAKAYTESFVYFLQTEMGFANYKLSDVFGTKDNLAKIPYVRESRRLQGVYRMTQNDVVSSEVKSKRPKIVQNSIAIGDYPIDLHFCSYGNDDLYYSILPYQIPYETMIPKTVDGFMAIEKNISVSHIVNGTTRLQPVVMAIGEAAGIAAAMSSSKDIQPRDINIVELQEKLLEAHSNIFYFQDLPADHYAYKYAAELAVRGLVKGFDDLTFRPNNTITKGEVSKLFVGYLYMIDSGKADLLSQINGVLNDSSQLGISLKIKRAELAQFLSQNVEAAKDVFIEPKFEDVDLTNPYYEDIKKLVNLNIISANNAFFRPDEYATRAEAITMIGRAAKYFAKKDFTIGELTAFGL